MKVIDLLNKIANNEEVPNKIKYYNYIFEWTGSSYYSYEFDKYLERVICIEDLNYPIEILEYKELIKPFKNFLDDYNLSGAYEQTLTDYIHQLSLKVNYLLEKESDK